MYNFTHSVYFYTQEPAVPFFSWTVYVILWNKYVNLGFQVLLYAVLSRIYALSSVKFLGLNLRLCKKWTNMRYDCTWKMSSTQIGCSTWKEQTFEGSDSNCFLAHKWLFDKKCIGMFWGCIGDVLGIYWGCFGDLFKVCSFHLESAKCFSTISSSTWRWFLLQFL